MALTNRLQYYRRIFSAYLGPGKSQLTFWHETPTANPRLVSNRLGEYYMLFAEKADYTGIHDDAGIPLLDYRGKIGPQYNPIAIAQWGLANFNRYVSARDATAEKKFLSASDWLRDNLERNSANIPVWQHHFDWDYRDTLRAPWYSGLAQGQGISLLLRAAAASGKNDYLDAARSAFESLSRTSAEGGVLFVDEFQDVWIEEYIVTPPTHILNGFVWALWGVYDYSLTFPTSQARDLFNRCVETLTKNLARYDNGFWSLYEQSGTRLPMVASRFYHQLHIVQLRVMHQLTNLAVFAQTADRWEEYSRNRLNRARALAHKSIFKLCYY
jgi:heparosan-N-sulfate-glucuronate 5-epimerase